ncbi:glycoside hydrolase family 64 protein [Sanguibacter antarcticus]|uniref:Beta-1,3-glucanase n=1 Tax=Sanguibacter antarcticus TaxID=372484 RepID=A0A2A9E737_9MICO|nr:beta-1,3-glucanase family protein [Sanguibacter antarcticus]PFG34663.1 beta-1,3-glucanase [Sanguibacter antarcticus]
MLVRPRTASHPGAALLLVMTLVLAGLFAAVPARAAESSDSLPFTITNDSGLSSDTSVYVIARDQATGTQGWVDATGTWHAFDFPTSIPAGTPPPAAPDTSFAGPGDGESMTVYLGPGLVGGRLYVTFGAPLYLALTTDGLVEPAGWLPGDPNHGVMYDWVEFARDGSRLFINTTMVDMFSVPLSVKVANADGSTETQGKMVAGGRDQVFADLASDPVTAGLVQNNPDGTPLRAVAPSHGIYQELTSETYFDDYIADAWSYYASNDLTVDTALGAFVGRVSDGTLVFRDTAGATVGSFAAPTTVDVYACHGALQPSDQPNQTAALAIGARICAAFNRGTLSTATVPGSDTQSTSDADTFYPEGGTSNLYSAAMHRSQVNGKAYGFAYDDVADFSPSINSAEPTSAELTIGSVVSSTAGTTTEPTTDETTEPATEQATEPAEPAAEPTTETAPVATDGASPVAAPTTEPAEAAATATPEATEASVKAGTPTAPRAEPTYMHRIRTIWRSMR